MTEYPIQVSQQRPEMFYKRMAYNGLFTANVYPVQMTYNRRVGLHLQGAHIVLPMYIMAPCVPSIIFERELPIS